MSAVGNTVTNEHYPIPFFKWSYGLGLTIAAGKNEPGNYRCQYLFVLYHYYIGRKVVVNDDKYEKM